MTIRATSNALIGGMGAVAPMVTGRPRTGYTRRVLKLWLAPAFPARPGQQKRAARTSTTPEAANASKAGQP